MGLKVQGGAGVRCKAQGAGGCSAGVTNGNPCFPLCIPLLAAYVHNPKTHTGVSSMGSNEWRLEDEELSGVEVVKVKQRVKQE